MLNMTSAGTGGAPGGAAGSPIGGGGMASGAVAGTLEVGGMVGTGGATIDPMVEAADAVKALAGFRYEDPCGYVQGHPVNDGTCNSGEVCWWDASQARHFDKREIAIGGTSGHVYEVTLRIRGAIEPRDYPANCARLPGSPADTIGVLEECDAFANSATVTFNIYQFKIPDPPHVYFFNGVPVHPPHRVDPLDQTFTIRVAANTTIEFTMDDLNGGQIRNCSTLIEGVAPYPKVYDGNFFQLDVVSATVAPP
jgi:hypothetical protein